MDFLLRLEQSGFSTWIRESSSLFAFPGVLLLHTIGMGVVVGINAGIDLRILGIAPALPLAPMERFLPILWVGFWVNAATGVILVVADATTKLSNPDFYVKMVFIALAIINLRMLRNRVFRDPLIDKEPLSTNAKILAVTSLIFWLGAITAGRLMAYVGPVSNGIRG
ncbi:MAG TPA: hypothetical protein VLL56_06660 [Terriglobia bacterium]|nr:hypothetical protein [Terriglobia bacterium]